MSLPWSWFLSPAVSVGVSLMDGGGRIFSMVLILSLGLVPVVGIVGLPLMVLRVPCLSPDVVSLLSS